MKLKDKSAIVTGAASGIGKEIALFFAHEGAKVAIADLNKAAADATAAEIVGTARQGHRRGDGRVAMNRPSTPASPRRSPRSAASTSWSATPASRSCTRIEEFPFADWKKLLAIHLDGAFLTTKACLPHMYRSGRAAASSTWARSTRRKHRCSSPPYVTAKHGLDRAVPKSSPRRGPPHGVRANVICPGFVRTPLVDKQIPEQAKELGISEQEVIKNVMLKETVDGEFTTVDDVAEAALFFAAFPSNALSQAARCLRSKHAPDLCAHTDTTRLPGDREACKQSPA